MRYCPTCSLPLRVENAEGVEIDRCAGCGGTFFDAGELEQTLGAPVGPRGWAEGGAAENMGLSAVLCPAHDDAPRGVQMHVYRVRERDDEIDLDACPRCGGVWLLEGERERLQAVLHAIEETCAAAARRGAISEEELALVMRRLASDKITASALDRGVRRRAWLTYTITAVTAAVFLAQAFLPGGGGLFQPEFAAGSWPRRLALVPADFAAYALLTHGLLHAGVFHVGFNLLYFVLYSRPAEVYLGPLRFGLLYALGVIGGGLAHALLNPASEVPMVGASGGVMAILATVLVLMPRVTPVPRRRQAWVHAGIGLALFLALSLGQGAVYANVAWEAHVAGLMVGFALGVVFGARPAAA